MKDLNIVVKLTTACPGECKCCANRKRMFKYKKMDQRNFELEVFFKICRLVSELGGESITLSGGEPTIIKEIEKYMSIAREHNLKIKMNTNGWGVTQESVSKWLKLGLEQIVLSIYSLDRHVVKNYRGNAEIFDRSMKAAEVLGSFRKKGIDFIFIVQSTICKENFEELPKLVRFADKHNADYFWPSYLEDAVNLADIRLDKENIEKIKKDLVPQALCYLQKGKMSFQRENMIRELSHYYEEDYLDGLYQFNELKCQWLGRHITFYPNGVVYPCPGHEYFVSENEALLDYKKISNEDLQYLLNKMKNGFNEYCKYCPQGLYVSND